MPKGKKNLEILEEFINYKRTAVSSKSKIESYRYFIKSFLKFTNKPLNKITETDVINFINSLQGKYAIGSINCIKTIIKPFIQWYFNKDLSKFRNLNKICRGQTKERTYSPEQMLTREDVEKLVQGEPETRWKAFLLLFFYGGFRPSEVCNLEWKNIIFDSEGCFIKVFVSKNKKSFEKYIPEGVCFYLKKLQQNNSKYVFPTKRTCKHKIPVGDVPMTRSGVYQHLLPLARNILGKHVNPYILRHSIATILYNRDDLKDSDVASQMGHSVAMKQTYNNLSVDKIRERMKKIWIKPEDLPPAKKIELENRIRELEKREEEHNNQIKKLGELADLFANTRKQITEFNNKLMAIPKK